MEVIAVWMTASRLNHGGLHAIENGRARVAAPRFGEDPPLDGLRDEDVLHPSIPIRQ
jgi:hypothetical protein